IGACRTLGVTMAEPAAAPPRDTPLRAEHEALGAAFTDFGGWMMPVRSGSDLAEHRALREAAGLFDISHLGEILLHGSPAGAILDFALAVRMAALAAGKAKYTMILAEDGGISDDLIVYRLAGDRFLVVANAGNRDAVVNALQERVPQFDFRDTRAQVSDGGSFAFVVGKPGVAVEDVSDSHALFAVQGPAAQAILEATPGIAELDTPWAEQRYYAWASARFDGAPLLIARTGYTGEDGFELMIPVAHA